jgi:hypothetical protein
MRTDVWRWMGRGTGLGLGLALVGTLAFVLLPGSGTQPTEAETERLILAGGDSKAALPP